ncbi:MAG TPA: M1 family metallopeptidase [Myxococcota bacterium]|nr:M1 family metallopeptidase [Myxococcota bacterium]HRY93516.1 M1 family metallopeptidase [Myxococcota bacterium]HSA21295.1 M1 family metallopeptidase [Myxococcota bacterium]
MSRLGWLALALVAPALAGPARGAPPAQADPGGQTPLGEVLAPKPYDPAPFLRGLRKGFQAGARTRLGGAALGELPLYQMELVLRPLSCQLDGQLEINFTNTFGAPLEDVVLRTYPNVAHLLGADGPNLTLRDVRVNGRPAEARELHPTTFAVRLDAPLAPGGRVRIGLAFASRIPRLPEGADTPLGGAAADDLTQQLFGKEQQGGYGVYACGAGMLNLGFFYPIIPARTDGAWDTAAPAGLGDVAHFEVANYLVKVTLPSDQLVASSGQQVGEKPLGSGAEGLKEIYLLGTGVRNFALQVSSRYELEETEVGDVRVRYFHTAETAKGAAKNLQIAVASLKAFEEMFGPYPWPELDVADAPLIGGAGGMEYPGLVTIAMSLTTSAGPGGGPMDLMGMLMQQTGMVEFVIAHEVAHQWWHALVGSDSNRHPFLDEALANYSGVLYYEHRHGEQAATEQLEMQLRMPFQLLALMGGQDGVVDRPTSAFGSTAEYAALVYGKGALFLHAFRGALGGKALLKGLKAYARAHAFRQAEPADLVAALAKASAKPDQARALYRRWIEETHGDEDIGGISMDAVMQDLAKQMQGFHNFQMDGLDPAMLQMLQQMLGGVLGE